MIRYILSLFAVKEKTGSDIVAEVADGFDSMLAKLEEGKELIDADIETNQDRIAVLKAENKIHGEAKVKALNLIRGIEGIISGG